MLRHGRRGAAGATVAAAACLLCACESTELFGPSGRRARMVDDQLEPVLKQDFPVGTPRDGVRAKAEELGMTLTSHVEAQGDEPEEDVYSFSFDADSSWGVTRSVRVLYTGAGRVDRTILVEQAGRDAASIWGEQRTGGWIHLEGAP
jgi:hypothetical protein